MRKLFGAAFVVVVIVLGAAALLSPLAEAGSCNGRGKPGSGDIGGKWCRLCVVPDGCSIIECSKCGCDVYCPQSREMVHTTF